jgi:CBS domain-containing protein
MLVHKFGCLPVVASEEDDTLVGLITEADLVRYAAAVVAELDRAGHWGQQEPAHA